MPIREPLIGLHTFGYFASAAGFLVLLTLLLRLVAHDAVATCAKSIVSAYPYREVNPDALGTSWVSHSRRWWITEVIPPALVVIALLRAYCLEHSARLKAAAAVSPPRAATAPRSLCARRLLLLMFTGVAAGWLLFPIVYDNVLSPAKVASQDYECALGTFGRAYAPPLKGKLPAPEPVPLLPDPADPSAAAANATTTTETSPANANAAEDSALPPALRRLSPSTGVKKVVPRPNGVSGHAFYYCWVVLWAWYAGMLAKAARATARAAAAAAAAGGAGAGLATQGGAEVELGTDAEEEEESGVETETEVESDEFAGLHSEVYPLLEPSTAAAAAAAAPAPTSSSGSAVQTTGGIAAAKAAKAAAQASWYSSCAAFLFTAVAACLLPFKSPRFVTLALPLLTVGLCGWSFVITLTHAYHTLQQVLLGMAVAAVVAPLPVWAAEWVRVRGWPPLRTRTRTHTHSHTHAPFAAKVAAGMGTGVGVKVGSGARVGKGWD